MRNVINWRCKKSGTKPLLRNFQGLLLIAFDNSAGAVEALEPVGTVHVLDANFGPGTGCVEEVVVAEINADMRKGPAHGVEEDQITGLQLTRVDPFADLAHFAGGTGEPGANAVLEDQPNETTAIQSAVLIIAAETIIDANQLEALKDDILSRIGIALEERERGGFFGF